MNDKLEGREISELIKICYFDKDNDEFGQENALCYQLNIDSLFFKNGDMEGIESYNLKPQQSICFLTDKTKISECEFGIVFEKNKLSREGAMVLCPKFIDPGFDGWLSGTIINMSTNPISLRKGKPILEFLKFSASSKLTSYPIWKRHTDDKIALDDKKEKINRLTNTLPSSFLDLDSERDKIIQEASTFNKQENYVFLTILLSVATVIGTVFMCMALILDNTAYDKLQELIGATERMENAQTNTINGKDIKDIMDELKKLSKKVKELESKGKDGLK